MPRAAVVGVLGALALLAAGCGAQTHPNEPRPQVPTRVAVTIGPDGVVVQPPRIAFGPEENQQIPQNQNHPQPPIKTKGPLTVVLVTANQTGKDAKLELHGRVDASSETIPARSPGSMQTDLPTGTYTITAAGSGGSPGKLVVGPYRASSKNDLLLP
ncbi:MAG: hypothetical protein ABW065_12670 [Solirubrobacterales bacterium]